MTVKPKNSWCLCCKERVAGLIPVLMLHWNLTFRFRVKERHFALKNKSKTNCCSAQRRPTCNCGEGNSGTADQRVVDSRMPARTGHFSCQIPHMTAELSSSQMPERGGGEGEWAQLELTGT